jgi:peptidase E
MLNQMQQGSLYIPSAEEALKFLQNDLDATKQALEDIKKLSDEELLAVTGGNFNPIYTIVGNETYDKFF